MEAAVAEATAQTRAGMVVNVMRTEQMAGNTATAQQVHLLGEMNAVAGAALTYQRDILVNRAMAEFKIVMG